MRTFKILFFVPGEPEEELNNKILEMPIIPRIGDYVDLTFIPDPVNHPRSGISVVGEVTTVYIKNLEQSNIDAQVHVRLDEPK